MASSRELSDVEKSIAVGVALLNHYVDVRRTETSTAMAFFKTVAKATIGQKSDTKTDRVITSFLDRIQDISNFEACIKLIEELGIEANKAASNKVGALQGTLTEAESFLCQTLHAIRDKMLTTLTSNPQLNGTLQDYITRLKAEKADLDGNIADKYAYGMDASELVKSSNDVLLKLAFLGDMSSIAQANVAGFFRKYKHIDGNSTNIPICLMSGYYKRFMNTEIRPKIHRSIVDFEVNAETLYKKDSNEYINSLRQRLYGQAGQPSHDDDNHHADHADDDLHRERRQRSSRRRRREPAAADEQASAAAGAAGADIPPPQTDDTSAAPQQAADDGLPTQPQPTTDMPAADNGDLPPQPDTHRPAV